MQNAELFWVSHCKHQYRAASYQTFLTVKFSQQEETSYLEVWLQLQELNVKINWLK